MKRLMLLLLFIPYRLSSHYYIDNTRQEQQKQALATKNTNAPYILFCLPFPFALISAWSAAKMASHAPRESKHRALAALTGAVSTYAAYYLGIWFGFTKSQKEQQKGHD